MQYKFLNIFLDKKDLLTQSKSNINPFLLETNASQIESIYNFYKGPINLLYVNGFLGTRKAEIVNYTTSFLSKDTIILKYNCFNSTVLDDILLSFFSEFKMLSAQNIIFEPKVKTENFTQKINSYFSQIDRPFVIILDSFEAILNENRQEILDFVFHLNSMQKVKIIIIGRTFDSKYFKDIEIERVTTHAIERQIFEKYLKSEKLKSPTEIVDEFYKCTRGYYFFTALSVKIMKINNLSLVDFLSAHKKSYLPFTKFLEKQALTLIPASEKNLFMLLAIIRHPISIDLLKKIELYEEEKINYLIENLIIILDNSQIYVQDYLKEETEDATSAHISQRIRQYIIDLYLSQLPLKPLERDICISRQTMRKEIEFHKLFLPKKPKSIESPGIDVNYLSYSKVIDAAEKISEEDETAIEEVKGEKPEQISTTSYPADFPRHKNINIVLENLPFQQGNGSKYISKDKKGKPQTESAIEPSQEYEGLTLKEIMELAKQAEIKYHFTKVISLYQKGLQLKDDENFQAYLPKIYNKLAFAYQKVANHENALKYYELAQILHEKEGDYLKANYIKYSLAKIHYDSYRIDKAKDLFLQVAQSKDSPKSLVVKSYLQLANLEENISDNKNSFDFYKLAVENSDETISPEILSELYFKYALLMDDKNDTLTAIEFYNKCINLECDNKTNNFLSPAYSNIATLYLEKSDIDNAVINYTKAYEIDKRNENIEGTYYSASKLASILQKTQPEKALEYFNIALESAKLIKDVFYIVSASLAIGDFHYDKNKNEIALKYYIKAQTLAQNNFSQDNINKINIRINDIKFKLGVERYDNLVEIIKKQENLE